MKPIINYFKDETSSPSVSLAVTITILFTLLFTDISNAYWQSDPRISASQHPLSDSLAPAIGRLDYGCTAWIAKGGILITAEHCNPSIGDALEFNVPLSNSNGTINYSDSKDTYIVSQIIAHGDFDPPSDPDDDWAMFRVEDNSTTGLQPIEAQLVYITLKQDLTGTVFRTIGYGIDYDPGSPSDPNERHKTLQTDYGSNLTVDPDSIHIKYDTYSVLGISGAPVIDEATGEAVGVHSTSDGNGGQGTSAYRESFWDAYKAEQNFFTRTVTQKREGGQTLIGSTIGRWNFSIEEFDDHTLSGSTIDFNVWEGNAEVLRADQDVYTNPNEKYNNWEGASDVRNHRVFQMFPSATPLISQFKKTHSNITVTTSFPEAASANGSGNIEFKDPWLIDYEDPDFNDEMRNGGMDAEFYSHTAPFTPGFSEIDEKLYNGLFLNEIPDPNNPEVPYYTVKTPEAINFGSPLGTRPVHLLNWEGDDVDFETPDERETAVVFTDQGAEARAKHKISRVSNNGSAFKANQRKVAHTSDDWQHLVYESMGHIWYEAKAPSGDWEFIDSELGAYQRIHVDQNGGESPSLDHSVMDSFGYETTMIAYQDGSYIRLHPFGNYAGMPDDFYDGDPIYFSHGASSSFDVKPVVLLTKTHDVLIFWRSSQGIKYRVYKFSTGNSFEDSTPEDSGTITGTSGVIDFAVSKYEYNPSNTYFDVAFSVASGSGEAIKYTRLLYSPSSETVNQYYGTPTTISSGSYVRNKLPSITTPSLYTAKVGWVSSTSSSWSPYLTKATVAELNYSSGLTVSRTVFSQYVRSASVNKLANNSEWYAAWNSIAYTDPSYPPEYFHSNYVAKGSALGTIKKINTRGWDVQLPEAPSESDMQVFAYYPQQAPRHWKQSNSLGSYLKAHPLKSSFGRGISLSDSTTGVLFSVHDLLVDGSPVAFVPVRPSDSESTDEDLSVEDRLSLKPKAATLSQVQPLLVSQPFELTKSTDFTFGEEFGFSDSLAALTLLKEKGDITFTVELVEESSGSPVATLRKLALNGESGISRSEELWQVEAQNLKEGTVQLRISVESTIDGLTAVPEDYFAEYELKNKIAGTPSAKDLKVEQPEEITEYGLAQNYPNPFNPSTVISYQLPENSMVRLQVFDLLGRNVATLVNERQSTGRYSVNFDASHLASGVYIYQLSAGGFVTSKKMFLIK